MEVSLHLGIPDSFVFLMARLARDCRGYSTPRYPAREWKDDLREQNAGQRSFSLWAASARVPSNGVLSRLLAATDGKQEQPQTKHSPVR
jgi:hypothetical protein